MIHWTIPFWAELKSIKLEHSNDLSDFLAQIVKIKEAMTNCFRCRYPKRCSNCFATKSNCSHCFVCVSLGHIKYACPQSQSKCKNRIGVAEQRYCPTQSNKPSCEKCCVCRKDSTTLHKCVKCNYGKCFSSNCQIKQFKEHKKYCAAISQLESIGRQEVSEFTVSDTEILPTKYRNHLVRIIGAKPIIHTPKHKTGSTLGHRFNGKHCKQKLIDKKLS